jgi:hypothetical protein
MQTKREKQLKALKILELKLIELQSEHEILVEQNCRNGFKYPLKDTSLTHIEIEVENLKRKIGL